MALDLRTAGLLLALGASAAQAQVTFCRQFDNKTYCSGGVIIHQFGNTTVIPHTTPYAPPQPTLPSPLRNSDLPTLLTPYAPAGTQNMAPTPVVPYVPLPAQPATQPGPVLVLPPTGSRICHQFGTVLVCN